MNVCVRFRKPEALSALKQVWNGTIVYIGDNPIATKMRLRLLQPCLIPGTRPGTVQLPCDAHERTSKTLLAQGACRSGHTPQNRDSTASIDPKLTVQDERDNSNVVLKISRNIPSKPNLAKSILDSVMCVKRHTAESQLSVWKTGSDASDRIQHMFDILKLDMEKWSQMETVMEEAPNMQEEQLCQPPVVTAANLRSEIRASLPMQSPKCAMVCTGNHGSDVQ